MKIESLPHVALSLRQPWGTMVARGVERGGTTVHKDIENRRWNTKFRGAFLIHAAKGMTVVEHGEAVRWIADVLGVTHAKLVTDRLLPTFKELPRGGIIGVARLVGVIHPCPASCYKRSPSFTCPHAPHRPWHMLEQFGFVLEDIRPLPFVECKGSLGFFKPDESVIAKLRSSSIGP